MTLRKKPTHVDEFSYHELLDRCFVMSVNVEVHLVEHPVCQHHPGVRKKLEKAQSLLHEAYNDLGDLNFDLSTK